MACTDSIESIAVLMQQYQGFVVPFLINLFMLAVSMDGGASKEDCAVVVNYLYGQGTQVVLIHLLIFGSWKKGPYCWLVIAPYLFYGMAIAAYIIVPAALTYYTHEIW